MYIFACHVMRLIMPVCHSYVIGLCYESLYLLCLPDLPGFFFRCLSKILDFVSICCLSACQALSICLDCLSSSEPYLRLYVCLSVVYQPVWTVFHDSNSLLWYQAVSVWSFCLWSLPVKLLLVSSSLSICISGWLFNLLISEVFHFWHSVRFCLFILIFTSFLICVIHICLSDY